MVNRLLNSTAAIIVGLILWVTYCNSCCEKTLVLFSWLYLSHEYCCYIIIHHQWQHVHLKEYFLWKYVLYRVIKVYKEKELKTNRILRYLRNSRKLAKNKKPWWNEYHSLLHITVSSCFCFTNISILIIQLHKSIDT